MSKKYIFHFVLIVVAFLTITESYSQICSYKYRKRITIEPTKVAGPSDLTDFPVMIKITSDNDLRVVASGGHVESASGFDIVITAADGYTILNHQMEYYSSANGHFTAWVKVPILYTTLKTVLYLYYGNTGIVTDQSTTNVWTNYEAVWHLQNGGFNSNGVTSYTGTNNGTANLSPAYINDGRTCSADWIEIQNTFPNKTTNFSISGWAYTTNRDQAGQRIFCDDVNNSGGYAFSIGDPGTGGMVRFYSRSSTPVSLDTPTGVIANNTWYYFTCVADITGLRKYIYINGVQQATGTFTGAWGTDAGNSAIAGETAGGETANRLEGRIDEVHFANSALSADWILTEYNNQSSPSTFYTVSAEGTRWTGATNSTWSTGSNWVGGAAPAVGADVVITNGTNQPTLDVTRAFKSLWVQTSATLNLGTAFTFSDSLDVTNCGTITGNTGTLTFIGPAAYLSNYVSGTGTYNLTNLTANSSTNQGVTLNKDVNVSGALTLTLGLVRTTTANILALSNTATSTSGSATSFVSGPMSKAGTTAFIFPVGKGTAWKRIETGIPTVSTTFRAEYFNSSYAPLTPVSSPLHHPSSLNYWVLDRIVGTGDATVKLYWEDAAFEGINVLNDLLVAHYSGALWSSKGNGATTGGVGAGVAGTIISSGNVTTFSPFAFGAINGWANNPLPVTLLSFTAVENGNNVKLNWTTASEVNNDYFTVQKTIDGVIFENVMKVDGHGNSINTIEYGDFDTQPYNGQSYYRLAQTDFDGNITYSSLQPVLFNRTANNYFDFNVYPNPVNEGQTININLASSAKQEVLVVVVDVLGQEYYSKVIVVESGSTTIAIDPYNNIAAGTYIIKASSDNDLFLKKLIVK